MQWKGLATSQDIEDSSKHILQDSEIIIEQ